MEPLEAIDEETRPGTPVSSADTPDLERGGGRASASMDASSSSAPASSSRGPGPDSPWTVDSFIRPETGGGRGLRGRFTTPGTEGKGGGGEGQARSRRGPLFSRPSPARPANLE